MYQKRVLSVQKKLEELGLQGMLSMNLTNVRYLSGFTGSAGAVLVLENKGHFFSDTRYDEQSRQEVQHMDVHMIQKGYLATIQELNLLPPGSKVAIEEQYLSLAAYTHMCKLFPDVTWVPTSQVIEKIAAVKDSYELECLTKAIDITDQVFKLILPELKLGVTEREIGAQVSYLMKRHGAEGDSYDPIIASGPNSALPHARPGERALQEGDFIVMDFGALYKGYHADMTRTVVVGEPSDKHKQIYEIVLAAQLAGVAAAKAGITGAELDQVCRSQIAQAGYEKEFCHSTGHGIGLEVHTYPSVSVGNSLPLLENYVVTIEPGIYLPGWGGVRIEDDCWIRENGCVPLNKSPKNLISVG